MRREVRIRYLKSPAEIPRFRDETEEARFWAAHSPAKILDQLQPVRLRLGAALAGAARERESAREAMLVIDRK